MFAVAFGFPPPPPAVMEERPSLIMLLALHIIDMASSLPPVFKLGVVGGSLGVLRLHFCFPGSKFFVPLFASSSPSRIMDFIMSIFS